MNVGGEGVAEKVVMENTSIFRRTVGNKSYEQAFRTFKIMIWSESMFRKKRITGKD